MGNGYVSLNAGCRRGEELRRAVYDMICAQL